jgi:hypothetical protein
MRWLAIPPLLMTATAAMAQTPQPAPTRPPTPEPTQAQSLDVASLRALINAANNKQEIAALFAQRKALRAQLVALDERRVSNESEIRSLIPQHNALLTQLNALDKQIAAAEGPEVVQARDALQRLTGEQPNIDRGETLPQMFGKNCAGCHTSGPRGLASTAISRLSDCPSWTVCPCGLPRLRFSRTDSQQCKSLHEHIYTLFNEFLFNHHSSGWSADLGMASYLLNSGGGDSDPPSQPPHHVPIPDELKRLGAQTDVTQSGAGWVIYVCVAGAWSECRPIPESPSFPTLDECRAAASRPTGFKPWWPRGGRGQMDPVIAGVDCRPEPLAPDLLNQTIRLD